MTRHRVRCAICGGEPDFTDPTNPKCAGCMLQADDCTCPAVEPDTEAGKALIAMVRPDGRPELYGSTVDVLARIVYDDIVHGIREVEREASGDHPFRVEQGALT